MGTLFTEVKSHLESSWGCMLRYPGSAEWVGPVHANWIILYTFDTAKDLCYYIFRRFIHGTYKCHVVHFSSEVGPGSFCFLMSIRENKCIHFSTNWTGKSECRKWLAWNESKNTCLCFFLTASLIHIPQSSKCLLFWRTALEIHQPCPKYVVLVEKLSSSYAQRQPCNTWMRSRWMKSPGPLLPLI